MLYSVVVKFKSKEDILLKYYPGEVLHGILFYMLKKRNSEEATILHDEYETKPFTLSPILPYPKWIKGKRKLIKNKEYFFRVTFLEKRWYLLFMEYFLYHGAKLDFYGKEVEVFEVLTNSKEDKRCNSIEYQQLRKEANKSKKIKFKFHSTTTFRVDKHHIIFPEPYYLFYSLLKKWNQFNKQNLKVETDDFKKIYLSRYDLSSTMEQFKSYPIKGFRGSCEYEIESNLGLDKIRDINLLADFAFYSGVGYKTTMGLGQVSRL